MNQTVLKNGLRVQKPIYIILHYLSKHFTLLLDSLLILFIRHNIICLHSTGKTI